MPALSDPVNKLLAHPQALCNMVRRIALQAGDIVLSHFDECGMDESRYQLKEDGSPLTKADTEAEAFIIRQLQDLVPGVPVIGEEATARKDIPVLSGSDYFWLVDPLDGTLQFRRGEKDFTVNIALICRKEPMLGVIYAPARGELYAACGPETAVRWLAETDKEKSIKVRRPPHEGLTVVASRNHGDDEKLQAFLQGHKTAKHMKVGSSLKICLIAAGKADLYPRFGQTSEWDTAAGDAILRAAGGIIEDLQGHPLTYGNAGNGFANPHFVARSLDLAL